MSEVGKLLDGAFATDFSVVEEDEAVTEAGGVANLMNRKEQGSSTWAHHSSLDGTQPTG